MHCNVLLMGLTGVGKSSLINYLAGETCADAGIPASGGGLTRGIHTYNLSINGQNCIIADTEGLETSHSDFWHNMMQKELLDTSCQKDISEWYHIVIYCIGANGGRVQDIELQMLEQLTDAGYGIIVALTKADLAADEDIEQLIEAVNQHFDYNGSFRFIPVCAKKTRTSVLEGKEQLSEAIIDCWGDSLIQRVPRMIYDPILSDIETWGAEIEDWICNQKNGLFFGIRKTAILNEINEKMTRKIRQLVKKAEIQQTAAFKKIQSVYTMLNTVIDSKALSKINPALSVKIEKLESSFATHTTDNTLHNAVFAATAVTGLAMIAFPLFIVPVAIAEIMLNTSNTEKIQQELIHTFDQQSIKIFRSFAEQKQLVAYSLSAMVGYIYGLRELAVCYMKGRGVEQDYDKAVEYLNKIIDYRNTQNPDYADPLAEYYIGYFFHKQHDTTNARYWLKLSAAHGNKNAQKVLQGADIETIEQEEHESYEYQWSHFLD